MVLQGWPQDAHSDCAVCQLGRGCHSACWQPRPALCVELLPQHGRGDPFCCPTPICCESASLRNFTGHQEYCNPLSRCCSQRQGHLEGLWWLVLIPHCIVNQVCLALLECLPWRCIRRVLTMFLALQSALIGLRLMRSHRRPFTILKDVSGAIKPVRSSTCFVLNPCTPFQLTRPIAALRWYLLDVFCIQSVGPM